MLTRRRLVGPGVDVGRSAPRAARVRTDDATGVASVEDRVTEDARAAFARNRRKRFWYWFALWAVMAGLLFSDHRAVVAGGLALCLAAFLWTARSRRRRSVPAAVPGKK